MEVEKEKLKKVIEDLSTVCLKMSLLGIEALENLNDKELLMLILGSNAKQLSKIKIIINVLKKMVSK